MIFIIFLLLLAFIGEIGGIISILSDENKNAWKGTFLIITCTIIIALLSYYIGLKP